MDDSNGSAGLAVYSDGEPKSALESRVPVCLCNNAMIL